MKKLFALLLSLTLLLVVGFKAEAQTTLRNMTSNFSLTYDTIVDAGTGWLSVHNPGDKNACTFFIQVDKLTGTIGATADVKLQVSHDGTNWQNLNQLGTQTVVPPLDVADSDAWYHIAIDNNPGNYYRLLATGNGTSSWRIQAFILTR